MITFYKKLPFLKKLTALTMLVTLPILLILVLIGIGFVKHNNKEALKNKIETVNQITVASIIPDLLFHDIEAVKLMLQDIKDNSDVEYVCIQSNQTEIITSLGKAQNVLFKDYLKHQESEFRENQYYHYTPIYYKSNYLGTLITVTNTTKITLIINRMMIGIVLIVTFISLIWFITNAYVQKVMLRPILKLSSTIDNVVKTGYYRKKLIEQTYDDEIGVLYHNFNAMMQQIEKTTVSKNYLDSIMGSLAEMIIVLDIAGRIDYINEAVEKNTGYTFRELRGKNPSFLIANFTERKTNKNFESTIKTKQDKPVFVMTSTTSFYGKEGYKREILSIRNISEQKKAEAEVTKYYNALEASNAELAQKNEALEHFTSVASHDMKTPLRTISSFISLIERRLSKEKNQELNEYITFVKNGAKHLNCLIVDTLEYARIGSEAVDFESVDMQYIVEDIKNFVSDKADIKYTNLPSVMSNRNLIHKLFQNIVENGIKYNDNESKVINITYEEEGQNVTFAIKDNGIGIDEKYHEIIFERHRRLHNNEKYKGTGLGLAICNKITEQLKGEIWLNSQVNVGSTFYIKLPKVINEMQNE